MNEVARLLAECRAGDEVAFQQLVSKYLPYLERAIRRKLPDPLRRRFNTSDFAQEVWASFIGRPLAEIDLTSERAVVAYLRGMADKKIKEEVRHQLTLAQGGDRTVPLDGTPDPADSTPTPSALMVADERLEALADGLTEHQQAMVRMLAIGHSAEAVGEMFELNERTVRRLQTLIFERCLLGGAA